MRVFVAGATGAIGRPLIPKLVEAGHEVTGMTRSEERAAGLREAGARAVVADVFDEERVTEAVRGAGAEALVHELTALPETIDFRDPTLYEQTNRLRGEGTRILLDAARAAGARRFVAQSIAFAYAPTGDWVKDEDSPLLRGAEGSFGEAVRTLVEMERRVVEADGLQGLVLRYGALYGPGTHFASDGSIAEEVRRRRYPVVGRGHGVFSFIHVDDVAGATVAAVERGGPGVYNVVDDDPAPMREWLPVYAEALGAKKPLRVPVLIARLLAGKQAAGFATTLRGASNAKARSELGWSPHHGSWRQGFSESLG
jgi:nucleoside-diphosphate-sugar epimerase